MKSNRAVFWFIAWVVAIALGTLVSMMFQFSDLFATGVLPKAPPIRNYILLGYMPFVLIPLLGISCHYAIEERRKGIRIASILLMAHHIICVMVALFQL